MQQGFVDVNSVPTKVITWGKWVEDKFAPEESRDIIICIPGNPGITKFYTVFLQTIYEKIGFPIWVVGHAGHEVPTQNGPQMPPIKGNEELYNLQGQVQHKIKFIEKYVPDDAKIHFIGHSFGAWTNLQLLKREWIRKQTIKSYLLFPVIENSGATTNGKFLLSLKPFEKIILFIALLYSKLPFLIQNFVLSIYLQLAGFSKTHLTTFRDFLNSYAFEVFSFMGQDLLENINERDDATLKANESRLKLYYASDDNWIPSSFYESLKKDHPDLDAELCVHNFAHAFVFKNSVEVGDMVAGWIREVS